MHWGPASLKNCGNSNHLTTPPTPTHTHKYLFEMVPPPPRHHHPPYVTPLSTVTSTYWFLHINTAVEKQNEEHEAAEGKGRVKTKNGTSWKSRDKIILDGFRCRIWNWTFGLCSQVSSSLFSLAIFFDLEVILLRPLICVLCGKGTVGSTCC